MTTSRRPHLKRIATVVLGIAFVIGNLLVFVFASRVTLAAWIWLPILLGLFVCEFVLLGLNARWTGQWRAVALFWAIYVVARITATQLDIRDADLGVTLAMATAVYAMPAGWFAMVALAVRRDVSIVYLVAPFVIMPILLRAQVMASGSLLATLGPSQQVAEFQAFSAMEPFVMVTSCMVTLGFVTFIPHFLWLWVKEARRDEIKGVQASER